MAEGRQQFDLFDAEPASVTEDAGSTTPPGRFSNFIVYAELSRQAGTAQAVEDWSASAPPRDGTTL